ncbi:MAG TPA: hypothetical protein VF701_14680 [Thermoanaerobaculia bacterium]
MAIVLPDGLTSQQIRVLQEYRRMNVQALTIEAIQAIRHPTGGGEMPAVRLAAAGWLKLDESGSYALTEKGSEFLAIEATPEVAETSDTLAPAARESGAAGA